MTTKPHISYLDSIRGLAALCVITEHFIIAYGLPCANADCQRILDTAPFNFWWNGAAAVSMFFVLSGFVLSLKYFHSGRSPDLQRFRPVAYLITRLCRIWLPYALMVLISALIFLQTADNPLPATLLPASDWLSAMWHGKSLSVADFFREAFLPALPVEAVLIPQAWTLNIELNLSLLLPLGLLLIEKGAAWLIFFALFAMAFLGVNYFLLHFMLGLLIARYQQPIVSRLKTSRSQRRLTLIGGFLLYSTGDLLTDLLPEFIIWWQTGLGAGLLLLFALSSEKTQNLLSHPVLHHLGRISYSAYLLHMLVLLCLTPHILRVLETLTRNHATLWLGGYLLTVTIAQLLSLLAYRLLETPAISLGKRLAGIGR
ncbi:MAG: acyltransferase [Methylococcales bacterium]|nr:acyltransferase [Methylococcales bacterium]